MKKSELREIIKEELLKERNGEEFNLELFKKEGFEKSVKEIEKAIGGAIHQKFKFSKVKWDE